MRPHPCVLVLFAAALFLAFAIGYRVGISVYSIGPATVIDFDAGSDGAVVPEANKFARRCA